MRRDLLSRNIKAARSASRLTQEDAAFRAGMQTAVYSRIERGEVDPHLSTVIKIAEAFEIPLPELVDGLQ